VKGFPSFTDKFFSKIFTEKLLSNGDFNRNKNICTNKKVHKSKHIKFSLRLTSKKVKVMDFESFAENLLSMIFFSCKVRKEGLLVGNKTKIS